MNHTPRFTTTATHESSDNVALVVTAGEADLILSVLEEEIAASKNRLVKTVLDGPHRNAALAEGLAAKADALNSIAAALRRRNL